MNQEILDQIHYPLLWMDEYRTPCFRSVDETDSPRSFSSMCQSLSWSGTTPQLFMLGPVPVHGLWTTYFSRQSSKHCRLFDRSARPSLSNGISWSHSTQYFGRRQRTSGLAHIRPPSPTSSFFGVESFIDAYLGIFSVTILGPPGSRF